MILLIYEDLSVEMDLQWGRNLDSKGEPIYTIDAWVNPQCEVDWVEVFADSDVEEEWFDSLDPFTRM